MPLMPIFTKNVNRIRNKERGRRAFILANGPSVLSQDLSLLNGQVVIGMNASTILEERFGFSTKYYVLSDARFLNSTEKRCWATQNLSEITQRIVREDLRIYDDQILSDRTAYVPSLGRDGFSQNLSQGFYFGCTTTMLAIQLAWHLGCREVFLLGCDLRYPEESPRFYEERSPQLEDAFTSVQLANITNSAIVFEKNNRSLVNCSPKSFLRPYLPFREFSSVFDLS